MRDLLDFYTNAPLLELALEADRVREAKHPHGVVTYIVDRNINYTNVCTAQCAFCAFYRDMPSKEGYLLSKAQLAEKIDETIALGGSQILLQGGLHPDLGIEFYEELFGWMKSTYPSLWIHGLSPAEVKHICRVSSLSTEGALRRLVAAGHSHSEVARRVGVARSTVSRWSA